MITKDNCNSLNGDLFELHKSLSDSEETYIWEAKKSYPISNTTTKISFSQKVLSQTKIIDGTVFRFYYFLSPKKFNDDGGMQVFDIEKTIGVDPQFNFMQSNYVDIERVAKQRIKYNGLSEAQQEYEAAKIATYLAMDPPIADKATSAVYLIMNKMPGCSLVKIIKDDEGKHVLTWEERLYLIRASLYALKEQLTDNSRLHGDIKPQNLMVQSSTAEFLDKTLVKVIDYEGSCLLTGELKNLSTVNGTNNYKAPEHFSSTEVNFSAKGDVFSIGRVILDILGFTDSADIKDNLDDYCSMEEACLAYFKDDLASNLEKSSKYHYNYNLKQAEQTVLIGLLKDMLAIDPAQRITVHEAIKRFEKFSAPYISPMPAPAVSKMAKGTKQYNPQLFKDTLQKQNDAEFPETKGFRITKL